MKRGLTLLLCFCFICFLPGCLNRIGFGNRPCGSQPNTTWISEDGNIMFYIDPDYQAKGILLHGDEVINFLFYQDATLEMWLTPLWSENGSAEDYAFENWYSEFLFFEDRFTAEVIKSTFFEEGDRITFHRADGNVGWIEGWNLYTGCINHPGINDTLPTVDFYCTGSALLAFDAEYERIDLSNTKMELPTTSWWRIDLSELPVKGKTPSGDNIWYPDGDCPPVICIYDSASGRLQGFLRQDIAAINGEKFDLNAWDAFYDGNLLEEREQLEALWKVHTGVESYQEAVPVLDGEWKSYRLTLVNKECPALQYELNFRICGDDMIYLENVSQDREIMISVAEFLHSTGNK